MVRLAPATLPAAVVNAVYVQTIIAEGGSAPPYVFNVISGTLPTGLTLNTTGELSGTPTASGTFDFIVQARDGNDVAGMYAYTVNVISGSLTTLQASPS